MNYGINLGQWNSVFAVPTSVVDDHMKLAGAAQLKVLLYLLRHAGEPVTLEELAFAVGQRTSDTQDAVDYWINCGVMSGGESEFQPTEQRTAVQSELGEKSVKTDSQSAADAPDSSPNSNVSAAAIKNALRNAAGTMGKDKIRYQFDECMKFVAEDEHLKNMLTAVESILGKQLTHTEVTCFVTLVKWHGMPCTIVPMLIQYCKSIGKTSIYYIESTGIGWVAEEIDSFEKAERKISAMTSRRRAWNIVRSALEIPERKATDSELKYSDLWINAQHIDIELVRHAYDKCINKNGRLSFAYMNGIIKRYFERGITDIASALKFDEQNRAEMEKKRAVRKEAAVGSAANSSKISNDSGRYSETYATEDIEAILDAEWMSESVGSDSEYNYDD